MCSDVVDDALVDTRHVYLNDTFPMPVRSEINHQLYCQIEGEKEVLLVDEEGGDFPTWKDMKLVDDKMYGKLSPFINIFKVDYTRVQQYKDVKKFHIAKLEAGQCLYVPAGWLHQMSIHQ